MAEKDQANMKLWSAYLIGYHNGVEAMQNAVPIGDPNPFNLTTLLRELRAQERRDDE